MILSFKKPQLFLSISILLSLIIPSVRTSSSFIYAACFPSRYPPNTPFQSNLDSLLTSLANSASDSPYNSFASGNSSSSPQGSAVYGLYQCRNDLSAGECSSCVQSAVAQVGLVCPEAYAAALQLDGCAVRYSNEDFLGKLDTSVAFKKCGGGEVSRGDGGEFFRRRDDVLDDLGGGREFRVSSSGMVEGYAQCVGDLSPGDCASCLAQAVAQLKSACGASLAGDLFLQKCYARFWASGYYPRAAAADYTDDDVGRTVAIIVGILAGVALLVVFISFMKKEC